MKLYELNRGPKDNRYCGPAAYSFLTGINTSDASLIFRQEFGLYRVRGLTPRYLIGALNRAGLYCHRRIDFEDNLTLAQWLKVSKAERTAGRVWLVVAGNHFQIITGRRYACGRIGAITSIRDKRVKRRCRVKQVFEVTPYAERSEKMKEVKRQLGVWKHDRRVESDHAQAARRKAKKIASEYGMEIEVEDYGGGSKSIYFYAPGWLEDLRNKGEVDFTTTAYDWFEAEDAAREMEELIWDCIERGIVLDGKAVSV